MSGIVQSKPAIGISASDRLPVVQPSRDAGLVACNASDNSAGQSRKFSDMIEDLLPVLPSEWRGRAQRAAEAFGFGSLGEMPDHQWQKVLTHVASDMRSRGVGLPKGWRASLAKQAGRNGA